MKRAQVESNLKAGAQAEPSALEGRVHCFLGIDHFEDSVVLTVTVTLSRLAFHGAMDAELCWLR